jgi:hypothetical protein
MILVKSPKYTKMLLRETYFAVAFFLAVSLLVQQGTCQVARARLAVGEAPVSRCTAVAVASSVPGATLALTRQLDIQMLELQRRTRVTLTYHSLLLALVSHRGASSTRTACRMALTRSAGLGVVPCHTRRPEVSVDTVLAIDATRVVLQH